jgi:hypothetical protein
MYIPEIGQIQADDDQGYADGFDHDTMRHTDKAPVPDYKDPSSKGTDAYTGTFGSAHVDTFLAVFADGSVHSLRYTINPTVFKNLGNVNDGQIIDSSEF